MALDKATLKQGIIDLSEQLFNESANMTPAEGREAFAQGLADLIEAFVKSGDGIYQAGKLQAGANPVVAVGAPAIKII